MNKIEKLKKKLEEIKTKKQALIQEMWYYNDITNNLFKRLCFLIFKEKRLKTLIKIKTFFKKRLKEGEPIPPGYGIAWLDVVNSEAVVFPIPFNFIFAFVKKIWLGLKNLNLYEEKKSP